MTKPTATIEVSSNGVATLIRKATDIDSKIKAVAASGGSAVAVAAVLESLGLDWPGWLVGLLSLVIALVIGYFTRTKVTLPGGSVVDVAGEVDAVLHTTPDGNLSLVTSAGTNVLPPEDALSEGDRLLLSDTADDVPGRHEATS